jgi:hypothetical protein
VYRHLNTYQLYEGFGVTLYFLPAHKSYLLILCTTRLYLVTSLQVLSKVQTYFLLPLCKSALCKRYIFMKVYTYLYASVDNYIYL